MQEGLLQHLARLTDTPLVRRSAFVKHSKCDPFQCDPA